MSKLTNQDFLQILQIADWLWEAGDQLKDTQSLCGNCNLNLCFLILKYSPESSYLPVFCSFKKWFLLPLLLILPLGLCPSVFKIGSPIWLCLCLILCIFQSFFLPLFLACRCLTLSPQTCGCVCISSYSCVSTWVHISISLPSHIVAACSHGCVPHESCTSTLAGTTFFSSRYISSAWHNAVQMLNKFLLKK